MGNTWAVLLIIAGLYLALRTTITTFIMAMLGKRDVSLTEDQTKLVNQINQLEKETAAKTAPTVPDLTPDQVEEHWNKKK